MSNQDDTINYAVAQRKLNYSLTGNAKGEFYSGEIPVVSDAAAVIAGLLAIVDELKKLNGFIEVAMEEDRVNEG